MLNKFIKWLHKSYPDYYRVGVIKLNPPESEDRINYGTGRGNKVIQTHDLVYDRLNVELLKAFILKILSNLVIFSILMNLKSALPK